MWHEARKQEKKIRGMMVDYKKRAERRREYYERIKLDPTQFLQLHGRPCKIHLDPAIAMAADSPATMMPWQGQQDNMIDRFDVRAHLDIIPEYHSKPEELTAEQKCTPEDRQINYERYRILVQNDFIGIKEEKFLHQIYLEEQYGPIKSKEKEEEKRRLADKKAAIGYVYEDSTPVAGPSTNTINVVEEASKEEDDDSDMDFDLTVDVSQLNAARSHEINACGHVYGMVSNDFMSFMTRDLEEQEALRLARELEEEKGKKSRRERRAFREKQLMGRKLSPPSYAARESPIYDPYQKGRSPSRSASRSRSPSPINSGQITYITSFGGEESDTEPEPVVKKPVVAPNVTAIKKKLRAERAKKSPPAFVGPVLPPNFTLKPYRRSRSRSRSRSRGQRGRRRSRTRSRSRSRYSRSPRRRRHSGRRIRGRSSSNSRWRSRRRSSSRDRRRRRTRTRSRSNSRYRRYTRSRSRSRSSRRSCSSKSSISRSRTRSPRASPKSKAHFQSAATGSPSRKSPSPAKKLPSPPVRRYYGRRKSSSSDESMDEHSVEVESNGNQNQSQAVTTKPLSAVLGNSSTTSKVRPKVDTSREA